MRKTGERYTVARRHIVDADTSWELRGGVQGDTAAIANVLANLGVVAPHTGEPLTEAMVLGDRRRARRGLHPVGVRLAPVPLARPHARVPAPVAVPGPVGAGDRRAARAARRSARDRRGKGAAAALDAQLEKGLPAIVWIDTAARHRNEPEGATATAARR